MKYSSKLLLLLCKAYCIWWLQFYHPLIAFGLWLLGMTAAAYFESKDRQLTVEEYMAVYHGIPPNELGLRIMFPNCAAAA